ncbi:MAG TPA: dihydrolipoyl dehydrogenase [Polyangiaceae bacterium]|nr:dihydrolipoyl dehydrogenase [Polyangiaceae bacterium]
MSTEFDAIVLGGGPGGYPCAIRLGQLGQSVACVEEEEYGGVCLNWGCIPSKALISNAHLYHKAHGADEVGLSFGDVKLDVPKMQSWKDGIVKKLTGGVRTLLKANGATVVEGRGKLIDAHTVQVEGKGGTKTLKAKKGIVIATGSATIQVPGFEFDGKRIIGARQAVSLQAIPKRLLVVGGGVIGLELGMVYQAFGAELTVVELTPSLLPGTDPEAVKVVERTLKKRGAKIFTETRADGYELAGDAVRVKLKTKTGAESVECDQVLVAVGMKPRSRDIGLEALGVQIDPRGFVTTDDRCQTNVPGVYAIGDVSGPPMLAHKATKEGEVCAEIIAGHKAGKDWTSIPGIIFTDPEIATAGMSEVEAKAQGIEVKLGKFPFAALGRAMSIRETEGFVKVITDAKTKRVLGVTVVGPSASDLISEAMLAVEMTASAEDLALTVHPHPTLGEAMMEAGAAALGQAIHIANR